MYDALKALHVIGVVLLVGNVTITAYWKVMADRTGDPKIVAHAQRGVNGADWVFTLAGIALLMIGGYGAAWVKGLPLFNSIWLVGGQILFAVSGLMWLAILVPLQIRQGRAARDFFDRDRIPPDYLRDAQRWLVWGIIATVPLVIATVLMVMKP